MGGAVAVTVAAFILVEVVLIFGFAGLNNMVEGLLVVSVEVERIVSIFLLLEEKVLEVNNVELLVVSGNVISGLIFVSSERVFPISLTTLAVEEIEEVDVGLAALDGVAVL